MEQKESTIFLPSAEQHEQLIESSWRDFYERMQSAGFGIDKDNARRIARDFFVAGYTFGWNNGIGIIRGQIEAEELADGVQEDADEPSDCDVKLIDLGFSVRVLNCLKSANIKTLGDLLRVSASSLLKIEGFGKKSLDEIREFYEKHGYEFGSERLEYNRDRIHIGLGRYYLPKKGGRV